MRVLFADAVAPSAVEALTQLGHQCVAERPLSDDALPGRMAGFEALVVRSTKVTAATIEAADVLELIVRAGAGTTRSMSTPPRTWGSTSRTCRAATRSPWQLTMGLLLAIDRRIADNVADLRTGTWNKKGYSKADGLYGKTFGIVGLGEIGFAVAERAAAFGLRVLAIEKDRDEAAEERIARSASSWSIARHPRLDVRRRLDPRARHVGDRGIVRRPLLGLLRTARSS